MSNILKYAEDYFKKTNDGPNINSSSEKQEPFSVDELELEFQRLRKVDIQNKLPLYFDQEQLRLYEEGESILDDPELLAILKDILKVILHRDINRGYEIVKSSL